MIVEDIAYVKGAKQRATGACCLDFISNTLHFPLLGNFLHKLPPLAHADHRTTLLISLS